MSLVKRIVFGSLGRNPPPSTRSEKKVSCWRAPPGIFTRCSWGVPESRRDEHLRSRGIPTLEGSRTRFEVWMYLFYERLGERRDVFDDQVGGSLGQGGCGEKCETHGETLHPSLQKKVRSSKFERRTKKKKHSYF